MNRINLAVLISGRGSNLKAITGACAAPDFPARVALVIANVPDAGGLAFARAAGIESCVIDHRTHGRGEDGRRRFETVLDAALRAAKVDLVCLAGFMRLLTPDFVNGWKNAMLNIHPSLLPAYRGLNVHERMIEDGVRIAGCTVHFVSTEMDAGPIVGQAAVPVSPHDDPASLAARILEAEHLLYPHCIRLLAERAITMGPQGRINFSERAPLPNALFNPSLALSPATAR